MRIILIISLLAVWAGGLSAQDAETDTARERGLLQAFIEDNLSGAGRGVRISGFQGALSSEASLEELTIADSDGIWLTLRDVTLEWTRSALLRGRLEVNRLTAQEIILERLPNAQDGSGGTAPENAQATSFALPELPVSVNIGDVSAARVDLGPPVLGEAVALSLEGSLSLEGGNGAAKLAVERLDDEAQLTLDAAYSNETRILAMDLELREGPGGIVSGLLNMPDRPALGLTLRGKDPIDDYEARMALMRNDIPRLTGIVRAIAETPAQHDTSGGDPATPESGTHRFEARLGGDLRPFFTSDLRGFFGARSRIALDGRRGRDGATVIDRLKLSTEQLRLDGSLELDSQGWPLRLSLDGELDAAGALMRLPMTGPPTRLAGARISARYDADEGQGWQADATIDDLRHDGMRISRARLQGSGQIVLDGPRALDAVLEFALEDFSHDDAAMAQAVGQAPQGRARLRWQEDEPLKIERLQATSGDATLDAQGELDGLADGFPVSGKATVTAGDLARFGPITGRDLAGAARASLSGEGTLLGGAFDLTLEAGTDGLAIGEPRLDPVLSPPTTLRVIARRDEEGTVLDRLQLDNEAVKADISGRLDAQSGTLDLAVSLAETSLVEPRLSGPAKVNGGFGWTAGGALTFRDIIAEFAGAELRATGQIEPAKEALPVQGRVSLTAPDLSRFSALAGRPLAGQVSLRAQGDGALRGATGQLDITLEGRELRSGMAELDKLIAGRLDAALKATRESGQIALDLLSLKSGRVSLEARGSGAGAPINVSARLDDLGLLAPGVSGPAEATGQITLRDDMGRDIGVDLSASGPGGTAARITGNILNHGQRLALKASGAAPLGLANSFIAPRSVAGTARYDLSVNGPPALSSVSGNIDLSGARVSLPTLSAALTDIGGRITLSDARAQFDLRATGGEGGDILLRGPIELTPPFQTDLAVVLAALVHSDPELYRTAVGGRLTVSGPLTAGARVAGNLALGPTEIRIPSSDIANVGLLPQIRHRNDTAEVIETRRRAGLVREEDAPEGPALDLDITITAPNRIFVRGRGLDAELGGTLVLRGTTNNVVPSGTFALQRGRLDILGRRLELTEGLIDLRGAFDPYLRFLAQTEADDMTVNVIIEGLASAPEITFTSTPELPQEEVVSRLLFGRSIDKISPFQAAQLAAAVATLTGQLEGGFMSGLRNSLGLSNLDVTTNAEGTTEFTAGAYISKNIYSKVTADSDGNQRIDLNLDVSDNVTVRGSVGTDGNTGVGVFYERDY
ncbi:MAG: translocation/assembly module TamB domain-containing protein [Pseudomonadota bacterium]